MADRVRVPNLGRTPTADPADVISQGYAIADLSDFAPSLKGGVSAGTFLAVDASGDTLVSNGDYSQGSVSDWTPTSCLLSIDTANTLSGSQSLKVTTGAATMHAQSPTSPVPAGALALQLDTNILTSEAQAVSVRATVYWLDDTGSALSNARIARSATVTAEWVGMEGVLAVPAGAAAFYIDYLMSAASTVTSPIYFDLTTVTVGSVHSGLHLGKGSFGQGIVNLAAYGETTSTFQNTSTGAYQNVFDTTLVAAVDVDIPVQVIAWATGQGNTSSATAETQRVKVGVSFDGSTYTYGQESVVGLANLAGFNEHTMHNAMVFAQGFPTSGVQIRVQCQLDGGTASSYNLANPSWYGIAVPLLNTFN